MNKAEYTARTAIAKMKMLLSGETACYLADGTIATLSHGEQPFVMLWTPRGRRINKPRQPVQLSLVK